MTRDEMIVMGEQIVNQILGDNDVSDAELADLLLTIGSQLMASGSFFAGEAAVDPKELLVQALDAANEWHRQVMRLTDVTASQQPN